MKLRGFTLIELLVVISIISLLSSVVMSSLNSARSKARDARRLSDLRQILNAATLYYQDNGTYPAYSGWSSWGNWSTFIPSTYIDTVPADPQNIDLGACASQLNCHIYHYCSYNSNANFSISVNLENAPKGTYTSDPNCGTGGPNLVVVSQ
ncbi:MAG TPA: prepilin-type N-terminal cleavage/methylation domain-containing protein [Candidatus Paceibacterota bacterium]|nr:prepilin-type N-terminal cleavage/methylation domain-containing protein [Candidatus Paceibacterota bacterium]